MTLQPTAEQITSPARKSPTCMFDTKRIWGLPRAAILPLAPHRKAPWQDTSTRKSNTTPVTVSRRPLWLEDIPYRYGVWLAPRNRPFGYFSEFSGKVKPLPLVSPQLNYSAIPSIERYFIDNHSRTCGSAAHTTYLCVTFGRRSINTIPLERKRRGKSAYCK